MDDDEPKTLVMLRDASSTTIRDIVPDAPTITPFEVVFDRETVQPSAADISGPYRALEIWTQNRLYLFDSTLTCVEIYDRRTSKAERAHPALGARLIGGQRKYGKTMHQTRPFPVPGTEAVLSHPGARPGASQVTSKVQRVVLHVRVTTVVLDRDNAWDDVTNAILHPRAGSQFDD